MLCEETKFGVMLEGGHAVVTLHMRLQDAAGSLWVLACFVNGMWFI